MYSSTDYRSLGWFESYAVDLCAIVIGVCELETDTYFDKKRLETALHRCIDRHHNLRLNIESMKKPYQFRFISQPYVSPIYVEMESDNQWHTIVDEEVNKPFEIGNDRTGLLKLLVLYPKDSTCRRQYLLIKYHHAIADGTSGMIILNTLLSYYFNHVDSFSSILPHLTDSETLAFPHITSEDERKTQEIIDKMVTDKRHWTPTIPYEVTTGRNGIKFRHGTSENMSKLLERCHKEKVTIGSVLLTSIYFAIAELVKDSWLVDEQSQFDKFQFDLDVNLRHRYTVSLSRNEHVGLHIAMMNIGNIKVSLKTKFWTLCQSVYKELQNSLFTDKHRLHLRASRLYPVDREVEERTHLFHGHINDLNFSNIGAYSFQQEFEGLKLKHYYCVGSNGCPTVATNIILICSVESLDYVLLHESGEKNQAIATQWFYRMTDLADNVWNYDENWCFNDFMETNN